MQQSERVQGGVKEGGEQSRRGSWSDTANTSLPTLRTPDESGQILINLSRQIPELKHPLSLRKQTTANRSNRQRNSFLATSHSPLTTRISNRELLGLEILQLTENKGQRPVLIANFEPNDFLVFLAGCRK